MQAERLMSNIIIPDQVLTECHSMSFDTALRSTWHPSTLSRKQRIQYNGKQCSTVIVLRKRSLNSYTNFTPHAWNISIRRILKNSGRKVLAVLTQLQLIFLVDASHFLFWINEFQVFPAVWDASVSKASKTFKDIRMSIIRGADAWGVYRCGEIGTRSLGAGTNTRDPTYI